MTTETPKNFEFDDAKRNEYVDSLLGIEIFSELDTRLKSIESEVIRQAGSPEEFAIICEMAYDKAQDPEREALLGLGIINGLRRLDDNKSVIDARKWFDIIKSEIESIPEGVAKKRCETFWDYQAGVFMARQGFYVEAIALEKRKSEDKSVPESECAISEYLILVYSTWQQFKDGKIDEITQSLDQLRAGLRSLESKAQDETCKRWASVAGRLHLLQVKFLINEDSNDEWDTLFRDFNSSNQGFGTLAKAWLKIFEASKDPEKATLLLHEGTPDAQAAAHLIIARNHVEKGRNEEARKEYILIKNCPNGHMIAAVAARELAAVA